MEVDLFLKMSSQLQSGFIHAGGPGGGPPSFEVRYYWMSGDSCIIAWIDSEKYSCTLLTNLRGVFMSFYANIHAILEL